MATDGTPAPGRMLVADDDHMFRARLLAELAQHGFDVVGCGTVSEALARAQTSAIDYAVVEMRLADGSGLDIIAALKETQPKARCVVLTGYGDTATAVAAVKLGAVDYLTKPETVEVIVAALQASEGDPPPPPAAPIPPNEARRRHIEAVFRDAGGNVSHAARLLNMHRRTLQRILRRKGSAPQLAQPAADRQQLSASRSPD